MGNENSLFSNNNADSNNQDVTGEDALKLLVGESGKYKTVEDLAKAALHGQSHISDIEKENATLRDAATKQSSIDDILNAIKGQGDNQQQDDNQNQNDNSGDGSNEVDVKQTVIDIMAQQSNATAANNNKKAVQDKLSEELGDNAGKLYSKTGDELGVDLDKLSEQSPQAVINLVLQRRPQRNADNTLQSSTVRHGQQKFDSGELTHAKIQEMYKEGKIRRDEKFKLEHAQLTKLGRDKFWS